VKPTLATARLRLRALDDADLAHLVALDADPEVARFVDLRAPPSPDDVRAYTARWRDWDRDTPALGFWIAEHDGAFAGWFHLRPPRPDTPQEPGDLELGYRLRRALWGRGLAPEGSRALVGHGFALGAPRVTASALAANIASIRVMEKVGMRRVLDWTYVAKDGTPTPAVLCGVTRPSR
jgi:RimJ/RimL family protein N-acetyltransferase